MHFPWFRRRNYLSLEERETRRTTRSAGIRGILFVSGLVFLCFVAFVGLTLVLLPMLNLRTLEQERDQKLKELSAARKEEKRAQQICNAVENDPEFNEVMARDKGMAKPGEHVIKFPKAEPTPTSPATPITPPIRD